MAESLPSRVECWTCSNGLVVFCVDTESDRMLLECEECMVEPVGTSGRGRARAWFPHDRPAHAPGDTRRDSGERLGTPRP